MMECVQARGTRACRAVGATQQVPPGRRGSGLLPPLACTHWGDSGPPSLSLSFCTVRLSPSFRRVPKCPEGYPSKQKVLKLAPAKATSSQIAAGWEVGPSLFPFRPSGFLELRKPGPWREVGKCDSKSCRRQSHQVPSGHAGPSLRLVGRPRSPGTKKLEAWKGFSEDLSTCPLTLLGGCQV